jgi:UV DNA damage endonuclease
MLQLPHLLPKATLRLPPLSIMARKRMLLPNGVAVSTTAETSTVTPPPSSPNPPAKRKISTRTTSGTKRKPSLLSSEPASVKPPSSTVIEASENREASPDEGKSQNPDLDDGDQAAQTRHPAVNSDILPIPWKGRLGFACRPACTN